MGQRGFEGIQEFIFPQWAFQIRHGSTAKRAFPTFRMRKRCDENDRRWCIGNAQVLLKFEARHTGQLPIQDLAGWRLLRVGRGTRLGVDWCPAVNASSPNAKLRGKANHLEWLEIVSFAVIACVVLCTLAAVWMICRDF